jgi:hypothetical protein
VKSLREGSRPEGAISFHNAVLIAPGVKEREITAEVDAEFGRWLR